MRLLERYKFVLGALIVVLLAESILTGLLPHSRGFLYGILETKVGPVWIALACYALNYFVIDFFQAIKGYFVLRTALFKREHRMDAIHGKVDETVENAPQRVQEDIKLSYLSRITVWAEYFVSGTILVQLVLLNVDQPILIGAALMYAGISVLIAMKFNPRLTYAEKTSQKAEATFRAKLIDSITDFSFLGQANKAVRRAEVIRTQYKLFTKLQICLVITLPYIVLIPGMMDGEYGLGYIIKHQATFALIAVNAAILIQFYTELVKGKASEERVLEVMKQEK